MIHAQAQTKTLAWKMVQLFDLCVLYIRTYVCTPSPDIINHFSSLCFGLCLDVDQLIEDLRSKIVECTGFNFCKFHFMLVAWSLFWNHMQKFFIFIYFFKYMYKKCSEFKVTHQASCSAAACNDHLFVCGLVDQLSILQQLPTFALRIETKKL